MYNIDSLLVFFLVFFQRASLDIDLMVRRASVDSLLQIGHRLLAGEKPNMVDTYVYIL